MILLIPAILIAGIAVFLLSNEEERLGQQARATAGRGLALKAELLSSRITEAQLELEQKLYLLGQHAPEQDLATLERRHPLVRNVFIWTESQGLVLPDESVPLSNEQRSFIVRYGPVFSDGLWEVSAPPAENRQEHHTGSKADSEWRSGWIPWFWQNQLGYIGWVHHKDTDVYYGVELEMIRLVMDLTELPFGEMLPEEQSIGLVDGNERLLCRWGGAWDRETIRIPVGESLPHWSLVLYTSSGTLMNTGGIRILSGLLVFILFTVLFVGGILLVLDARRARLDAEQKTTFVSNVSHELKTPLTTIRMYADLLSEKRVTTPEKEQLYLKTIVGESERLTRLVNNVLDFSRLEQQRKNYRIEPVDLSEMIRNLVHTHRLRLQETKMDLDLRLHEGAIILETDRDAVEQVVINLLDNAIKYAAAGGRISLSLDADQIACRISVSDAGAGIPKKHECRIFERFYRIDSSLTSRHQGCGLGLAISAHLLSDLGGSLHYETSEFGGACFVVTLPLNEASE